MRRQRRFQSYRVNETNGDGRDHRPNDDHYYSYDLSTREMEELIVKIKLDQVEKQQEKEVINYVKNKLNQGEK